MPNLNFSELEKGDHLIFFYNQVDKRGTFGITVAEVFEFEPNVFVLTDANGVHWWSDLMTETNLNVYKDYLQGSSYVG